MEYGSSHNPEQVFVESMALADRDFLASLREHYPAPANGNKGSAYREPGDYWGVATAIICAKFGVDLGFEEAEDTTIISGRHEALNYWLHLTSFEGHDAGILKESVAADSEARSGLYTILSTPRHAEIFEHVYAAYKNIPVFEVMQTDPMFARIRYSQMATMHEITDHEGVERLYKQDPEHCLRLYLTRQLPHLRHLRSTIEYTKAALPIPEDANAEEPEKDYQEFLREINKERAKNAPFNQARLTYWQTEYDFTIGLLLEGYKPYTLEEILPYVEEYLVSLLAEHPHLSPSQLKAVIPDQIAQLHQYLSNVRSNPAKNN